MQISNSQKSRSSKLWTVFVLILLSAVAVNQPTIKAIINDDLPSKMSVDVSQPDVQVFDEILSDTSAKLIDLALHL